MRAQIAEQKAGILAFLRRRRSNRVTAPPVKPRSTADPAPLSFAQERLWFLDQLDPGRAVYNICRASRLLGTLNTPVLQTSLNAAVNRHETLRTAFRLIDGQPKQVVQPSRTISLETVDLSTVQESERAANIQREIESQALRSFDLQSGAMLRCVLLRVGEQEHILILATHHSAADAWSLGTLTRELWTLYDAFSNGRPYALEPLAVQYSDYAVWQREWLTGDVLELQLGYWKKRLKDVSVLNLPTDRPRRPRQSFHGSRLTIELPDDLTSAVNEMSHRFAVTPFMILLAAFQVLLYRYTGQEDVVVGSPIANRCRTELEGLMGFFVNTLVLRADLSGNLSFSEFLSRVRDTCVGADANQDLPFEKLVQELQPERDQSRNPLFQVMFVLQNATRPFTGIPGLRIEPLEVATTRSPFDLSLFLRERDRKYVGNIEYSTDLFDHDRIERMAGHFQILLEAIVKEPDQSIAKLPILTEAERHRILVEWNDTAADYPKDKCIHQLFEAQVERTPEGIAVEFEDQQITYRELNRRANQLAHYLLTLAVGPEKLVGICVERSIEMVVGLLGILKAGSAYVPLDPAYPKERLRFMLKDANISVLVTQEKLLESTQNLTHRTRHFDVCLDRDLPMIEQQRSENPVALIDSHNLAYVIYTSGSMGQPKGIAIEHQNTVALLNWAKEVFLPVEIAGVLASTSICFDLSVFELLVPLSQGGKIVLVENVLFLHEAASNGITLVNTVPSAMAALLAAGALPASVRVVNLAGEPLRSELVNQLYQTGTVKKVYDLYGPSETTTYSTFTRRTAIGPATIGRPIANTRVYLLDSHLQPVPVGVPGELCIGGAGVARGYLHRPELSAAKFITDPFSKDPNARIYRTGDLARYLPDGNIEFLGRTDNQVKIRGYRVELGEIESVLNQHPVVTESVVVASSFPTPRQGRIKVEVALPTNSMREETPLSQPYPVEGEGVSESNRNLIAYFVSNTEKPSAPELRSFLSQRLPEYMIPSAFVVLEALPLTLNGKIDRSKLPPPDRARQEIDQRFVEPLSENEELVAQIWREVLKLDKIGIHDNFFELGGHSLLATQVAARLSDAFNREIPLKTLFDAPSVAMLTESLESIIRDGNTPKLPPIVPMARDRPLPLSVNQEHLWRLDQMIPGTHFFNMPFVYQLSGCLNIKALEKAIAEIIRRQEALRTVFIDTDGRPAQVIEPASDFQLPVTDLRSRAAASLAEHAASLILEEREQPFALSRGPLFRTKLLRLTDDDHLFLITMHHIIGDHWSMLVFRRELVVLYKAFSHGRSAPLPELSIQFADFACWERRAIERGSMKHQLVYWKKQLAAPAPELRFQRDGRRRKRLPFQICRQSMEFDENLFVSVKALARKENCTPFLIVLTALNAMLYLYTRETDIPIGTLVANRRRPGTEGLIGHFVNTVVLRTRFSPEMTFSQLLAQVREVTLSAHAHQELPFEHLAHRLDRKKNTRSGSLFQVLFIYQNWSFPSQDTAGLSLASVDMRQAAAEQELMPTTFDLIFNLREASTMLTGTINYKVESVDEDIVRRMRGSFGEVLQRMIAHIGQRFANLSVDVEI